MLIFFFFSKVFSLKTILLIKKKSRKTRNNSVFWKLQQIFFIPIIFHHKIQAQNFTQYKKLFKLIPKANAFNKMNNNQLKKIFS